ncbi:MAG: hypothetical protein LJE85_06885 [Gammaproteobacteria bacterium]|jgi:hypothetical protein|nr:hypothetical protein [Gammaproteobacteria bacterium]
MEHNVRELNLNVRVRQDCEPVARGCAEEFAVSVLQKTAALLEQKIPGYCVFIKEVDLRWQLQEDELVDIGKAQQIAQQFVQRIRQENPLTLPINTSNLEKDIAVFESEAHWRAANLYALAHQEAKEVWYFRALEGESHPLEHLGRDVNHNLAWSVLQVLAARHELVAVFRKLDGQKLNRFCDNLINNHAQLKQLVEKSSSTPNVHAENSLANIMIKELHGLSGHYSRSTAAVLFYCYGSAVYFDTDNLQSFIATCFCLLDNGDAREPSSKPTQGQDINRFSDLPGREASILAKNINAQTISEYDSPSSIPRANQSNLNTAISAVTELAGVFYMLNPALELNIGEWLWQACLPESQILRHALVALLENGSENDIAVELFSGATLDETLAIINREQQQEVCQNLLLSLIKAIPRRGLAQYPVVHIELVERENARFLIAHEPCSPFCVFAWPGDSTRRVLEGLDIFLKCWSHAAPHPQAPPQIAELDITGRIQYMYKEIEIGESTTHLLPETDSLNTTALLAQVIGSLGYLVDKRASAQLAVDTEQFVSQYIQVPGSLDIDTGRVVVNIEATYINHQLRKAGADMNPGWVPWLERKIEFNFIENET